ncbi:MAG: lipoyl(octanoyl) transferase LipB, partial [Aeromicrobium sp.]
FDTFVPCGISDAGVSSLSTELGRDVTVQEAAAAVKPHLAELLHWDAYKPSVDLVHDESAYPSVAVL